jgi:glycosyltransferase involved in cell wall biosynthesis
MFSSKSDRTSRIDVHTMNDQTIFEKTLIVLPARNEEAHIGNVLSQLVEMYPEANILVINDDSSDRTSQIVSQFHSVILINLPFWMGYGGALQTGYKYALANGYKRVVQMDADEQHDPSEVRKLLQNSGGADIVIGSRFKDSATKYRMPFVRKLGCRSLSFIGWLLTGLKITDPTSGFQVLNHRALQIACEDHYPLDYPDLDVLILMQRRDLRVVEVPVVMHLLDQGDGMHAGIQVWYYAVKMLLSMLVMMLRKA